MKSNIFTIRTATDADFPQLCELIAELDQHHIIIRPDLFRPVADPPRKRDEIAKLIAGPDSTIVVAADIHGWGLLGFAIVIFRRTLETAVHKAATTAEVDHLSVRKNVRRLGIGRALLDAARDWASSRGTRELSLIVYEFNASAVAFYESAGFTTLRRKMVRNHL